MKFGSRRFQFALQFCNPRTVPGGTGSVADQLGFRIVNETNQQQVLIVVTERLHGNAERAGMTVFADPAAGDDDAHVLLAGLLNRRTELGPHTLPRHRQ